MHNRHDSQRHTCNGRCSLHNTVILTAVILTVASCAWIALVVPSRSPVCWKAFGKWHGRPSSFPLEASLRQHAVIQRLRENYNVTNSTGDLSLGNIVFGIAGSAKLWHRRKEYVKLWWRPQEMLGFVWLDQEVSLSEDDAKILPQVLVSEDTSRFRYTHSTGHPSGIRIARIILETFKLGLPGVKWFVLGDDDTVFSPDNLLNVLKKYDYNEMYYIGNPSDSHFANQYFSHYMAFGGGGIAISYPLAKELASMLDECINRYPSFFGSDDRLYACITEIGVPLTKEPGFHQLDIHGDPFGLLSSHPISPFLSIHHLDEVDAVFPRLSRLDAMKRFSIAMQTEPSSFLQQSFCYDYSQKLSFSISMGYAVQVFPYILLPKELEKPETSFVTWDMKIDRQYFSYDTRMYMRSICQRPFVFFFEDMHLVDNGAVISTYRRDMAVDKKKVRSFCFSKWLSPDQVDKVQVLSQPLGDHWFVVPQRQCSKLMGVKDKILKITVSPCQYEEL